MSAQENPPVKRPNYFLWTSLLVGLMAVTAVVNPTLLTGTIAAVSKFFYLKFDWLIMWLPLLAFGVGLAVALSPRFGNIRLGGKDAVPEYSFLSWMNMLFTAGIGVGIVFFGPIEALWHYFHSPIGVQAAGLTEYQKVENAMSLALHVWGIPAWSLYMIAGLVMAYFTYQHKTECTPAAPLQYAFRHKKMGEAAGCYRYRHGDFVDCDVGFLIDCDGFGADCLGLENHHRFFVRRHRLESGGAGCAGRALHCRCGAAD